MTRLCRRTIKRTTFVLLACIISVGSSTDGISAEGASMTVDRLVQKIRREYKSIQTVRARYRFRHQPESLFLAQQVKATEIPQFGEVLFDRNKQIFLHRFARTPGTGASNTHRMYIFFSRFLGAERIARKRIFENIEPDIRASWAEQDEPSAIVMSRHLGFIMSPMRILLMPHRLHDLATRVTVRSNENDSHTYVRIYFKKKAVQRALFMDIQLNPVRMHQIVYRFDTRSIARMVVRDRRNVAGTSLPHRMTLEHVNMTSHVEDISRRKAFSRSAVERALGDQSPTRIARIHVQRIRANDESGDITRPKWTTDPVLPKATRMKPANAKSTLDHGKYDSNQLLQYINALDRYHHKRAVIDEQSVKYYETGQWSARIRRALRKQAESVLLREYLVAAQFRKRNLHAVHSELETLQEKQKIPLWIPIILAKRLRNKNQNGQADDLLRGLLNKTYADPIVRGDLLLNTLQSSSSAEAFVDDLQSLLADESIRHSFFELTVLEPPYRKPFWFTVRGSLQEKDEVFVDELKTFAEKDSVALLLARVHANSSRGDNPLWFYDRVKHHSVVQPELNLLLSLPGMEAKQWIEQNIDLLRVPKLLLQIAADRFRQGRTQNGIQRTRQLVRSLELEPYFQGVSQPYKDLTTIIAHLNKQNKKHLGRTLLLTFIRSVNSFGEHESLDREIKHCFSDRTVKLYQFVREPTHRSSRKRFMTAQTALDILMSRLHERKIDLADARFITHLSARKSNLKKPFTNHLIRAQKKAIEQYPDLIDLYRSLGDLHMYLKEYDEAVNVYRSGFHRDRDPFSAFELPTLSLETYESYTARQWPDDLYDMTIFERLISACKKAGRTALAEQLLSGVESQTGQAHGGIKRQVKRMGAVAVGYEMLGQTNKVLNKLHQLFLELYQTNGTVGVNAPRLTKWYLVHLLRTGRHGYAKHVQRISNEFLSEHHQIQSLPVSSDPETLISRFLNKRAPDSAPDNVKKDRMRSLIDQLGSRSLSKRKQARQKLKAHGMDALFFLDQAFQHSNPQIRSAVRHLIEEFMYNTYQDELTPQGQHR